MYTVVKACQVKFHWHYKLMLPDFNLLPKNKQNWNAVLKLHNLWPKIETLLWPEEEDVKGEAVLGGGDAGETQAGQ